MWIFFGDRERTKLVEGGASIERECPSCQRTAMFREHRVVRTFHLYTIDIANHGGRHVMVCGRCGDAFVTDEVAAKAADDVDQSGTLWGGAKRAMAQAKQAADAAGVTDALQQARKTVESGAREFANKPEVAASTEAARQTAKRVGDEVRRGVNQAGSEVTKTVDEAVEKTRDVFRGLFGNKPDKKP